MVYLLVVYVHVLATVFLVGYALFWAIVSLARPRADGAGSGADASGDALLDRLARTSWPPEGLPAPIRVKLPGLAWGALAVLLFTGAGLISLRGRPASELFAGGLLRANLGSKLVLVALFAFALLVSAVRPRRPALLAALVLLLAVVAVSTAVAR